MTNPNPFGSSVQFSAVTYLDQLNQLAPPTIFVPNFFPSVTDIASNGITIELWFKAIPGSSGNLVSVQMNAGTPPRPVAPLIYIDPNGFLRAGLFDSTPITLLSPQQNMIASQNANGVIVVGSPNALASPLSVVDGQWHHAALVVQPGAKGTQSLFLDGRLADSDTANGSFGLSFVASDGTTWTAQTSWPTEFGGPVTPQPAVPPAPNYLPYAQGFCGCLNELRTWNTPRSIMDIQQLMAQPLGSDWSTYLSAGLVGYAGSSQLANLVQTGSYLSLQSDAPPVDQFTDVTNRVPGYQNYGICTAIPFTAVALEVTFEPSQPYSTKISLCQTDQLQVDFPNTDANGYSLQGTFSMTVTGGISGQLENVQIAPNGVLTITALLTDCYRLDFTYSEATTVNNLQFKLIPGPLNTVMQLLLDVVPFQAAYTDPNYPVTQTLIPAPGNPDQSIPFPPYWPLFTDETVFPIDSNEYSADDLLTTYLQFNEQAGKASSDGTFSDFLDLSANHATISDPSALTTLLNQAYVNITRNSSAPSSPPQPPFDTAVDQIYAFIWNVNTIRGRINSFLSAYASWAQNAVNTLALYNVPSSIANQIYNSQETINANLQGPSKGDFTVNLLISSALWGLGAALPALLPAAALAEGAISLTAIGAAFAGSAGANALSDLSGSFIGSTTVQAKLQTLSYSTLEDVANNITDDLTSAYRTILQNFSNPTYLQTLFSNYGLLQALSFIDTNPLAVTELDSNNDTLTTGITYASWKALIPSVFNWTAQPPTQLIDSKTVFNVTKGTTYRVPSGPQPYSLGVFDVLQPDPWGSFYWMLYQVQEWQTGQESSPVTGQLFSICPVFYYDVTSVFAADWAISWSLMDTNNQPISTTLQKSLFGAFPLSLVDQNNPIAAAGYGWYCPIAKNAVTTPFEIFMNWGEGVQSFSPRVLIAYHPANGGGVYETFAETVDVLFAAAAAADLPPAAPVTLESSALSFGTVPIGSQSPSQSTTLTNNQENNLGNVTLTQTGSPSFVVTSTVPNEISSGSSASISVSFEPGSSDMGAQTGTLVLSANGQYGSISLTLQLSGTGIE